MTPKRRYIYTMKKKIIVWFQQDLRISDNPALYHAAKQGSIIPIYIFDEHNSKGFKLGQNSKWWLHHSLEKLSKKLKGNLGIYKGNSLTILKKIVKETKADGIYWNKNYTPWTIKNNQKIADFFIKKEIEIKTFESFLLWDPETILKKDQTPYKVFTPFFKIGCLKAHQPGNPLPKPRKLSFTKTHHKLTLKDLKLITTSHSLDAYWQPGEDAAIKQLKSFITKKLKNYKHNRNIPAIHGSSRLSPYLHFGEISPLQVWHMSKPKDPHKNFLIELGWREFTYNVLFYNPTMPHQNLKKEFDHFPWTYNKKHLSAWQKGMTGYPLIDAGMRELATTGYMHNRIRMITASFLIKNLMIDWRKGADWFWHLLVDADIANNSFNWQWVAGCGYDASPFFRIFNPVLQTKKFDPDGLYIKKWVPELEKLPLKYLANPTSAPVSILQDAGIALGKDYPKAIIDLEASRKKALTAYKKL